MEVELGIFAEVRVSGREGERCRRGCDEGMWWEGGDAVNCSRYFWVGGLGTRVQGLAFGVNGVGFRGLQRLFSFFLTGIGVGRRRCVAVGEIEDG